jgi:hypothetical protein
MVNSTQKKSNKPIVRQSVNEPACRRLEGQFRNSADGRPLDVPYDIDWELVPDALFTCFHRQEQKHRVIAPGHADRGLDQY